MANQDHRQADAMERLTDAMVSLPARLTEALEDFDRDLPRLAPFADDGADAGLLAAAFAEAWTADAEVVAQVDKGFDHGFPQLAAAFESIEATLAGLELEPAALEMAEAELPEPEAITNALLTQAELPYPEIAYSVALEPDGWSAGAGDMPLTEWAEAEMPEGSHPGLDVPDALEPWHDTFENPDDAEAMFGSGDAGLEGPEGGGLQVALADLGAKVTEMTSELVAVNDALKQSKPAGPPERQAEPTQTPERYRPTHQPATRGMPAAGSTGEGQPDIDVARVLGNVLKAI